MQRLLTAVAMAAAAATAVALPSFASRASAPPLRGASRYRAAVVASHPAGYWRFDDPRLSPKARAAVGGLNGSYVRARRVRGVAGCARAFDGRRSYVTIPDSQSWSQPHRGVLTVEFWMRPDVLVFRHEESSGYVWVVGKGEPHRQEWGFRMYGRDNRESPPRANRISFYAYKPGGGQGAGAYFQDSVARGRWIYVVGELTRIGVRIYRDGILRQGPPSAATLYSTYGVKPEHGNAPLRVGTRDFGSFFQGAVDELAVYPYALSAAQIEHHYVLGRHAVRGDRAHC
jgi:hypothetical protein